MARSTIKGTYTLDAETARTLDSLAKRWGTTKSGALRRAIRSVALSDSPEPSKLAALDRLQQRIGLSAAEADRWIRDARKERRAR